MPLPPIRNMENGTPFRGGIVVIPDNTNDFSVGSCIVYVGVSGDIAVITDDGSELTFKNHPVGYVPGLIRRVKATGTIATNLLALY